MNYNRTVLQRIVPQQVVGPLIEKNLITDKWIENERQVEFTSLTNVPFAFLKDE